ncbi:MAG: alpha-glucosidase/alpha-galactosidase [Clostridia bacterium]|nr:alpha-glucosidase/alpha-galactosidase [Clostridia bacterium]
MKNFSEDRKSVSDLKIAYIGGGSRGWAYVFMRDLACEPTLSGTIALYDIDYEAAKQNEKIGNALYEREDVKGKWKYEAKKTIGEALTGADFVVISILPGTFDEMESDVHHPEKYGIYQSVGDTTGPGGIVRALRCLPMFEEIALAIKEHCPDAWVINFTNPMTACVRTLYKTFPKIKAFGCCHEVFSTQELMRTILKERHGLNAKRDEIKINVVGVNHFTWITEAQYKEIDLFALYADYVKAHPNGINAHGDDNWVNLPFSVTEQVKFDLFRRYGVIAAAGDRHLAEFCPGYWYLKDPETVKKYGFTLTSVAYRKNELAERLETAKQYENGEKEFGIVKSWEESVRQIKALLGLGDFVTNVNIPNAGQVPNNPRNAVVETNAYFSADSVRPVFAGEVPETVNALVMRIIEEQEAVVEAALTGNYELAFRVFTNNPNVNLPLDKARELFDEMLENTKKYLPYYEKYQNSRKK